LSKEGAIAVDEASIIQFIRENFEGVDSFTSETGNTFFFYDPDHMIPFATLVTNDEYDQFSNLDRPGIFRLNIGVSKQTYESLFGPKTPHANPEEARYDFTALDRIIPHPVYGRQNWVCVLNPSEETFERSVKPLLSEAYERDVAKHTKRAAAKDA
jgi:hypothetical protein